MTDFNTLAAPCTFLEYTKDFFQDLIIHLTVSKTRFNIFPDCGLDFGIKNTMMSIFWFRKFLRKFHKKDPPAQDLMALSNSAPDDNPLPENKPMTDNKPMPHNKPIQTFRHFGDCVFDSEDDEILDPTYKP